MYERKDIFSSTETTLCHILYQVSHISFNFYVFLVLWKFIVSFNTMYEIVPWDPKMLKPGFIKHLGGSDDITLEAIHVNPLL